MSEIPITSILNALLRKGFVKRQGDHTRLWFTPSGRRSAIVTRYSHGERRADDWLQRQMAQLHLSVPEFARLIECTMSQEDYEYLMVERGHLSL